MKNIILIIVILLPANIYSQHKILQQLKDFYNSSDIECYKHIAQNNLEEDVRVVCSWWFNAKNMGIDTCIPYHEKINLYSENLIPLLTIQFINTSNFSTNDNIYDYIAIDSSIVYTFACVDNKKMYIKYFVNFFDGVYAFCNLQSKSSAFLSNKDKKLQNVIKNMQKLEPELILYSHSIRGFHDNNGFMYIKNDKIYVYRVVEKDSIELNEYLTRYFSLKSIRSLNRTFIPSIFIKETTHRYTGNTPLEEIMLCPKIVK
ncbi:hypothetical protein FACS1894178_4050 [Bacteroidia bacterium]|nr:hypothetical protein FACS1894178_4050 [Bacteroidia bacterium]